MRCPANLILAVIALIVTLQAQAQDIKKNSFGIVAGFGGGGVLERAADGGGSMTLKTGISLGFNYYRSISPKAYFETGLIFNANRLNFSPPFNPNFNYEDQTENLRLVYIPLFIRLDVSKAFFLQGGFLADIDFTSSEYLNSLSGVGVGIGLGFYIPLSEKMKFQINPFSNLHGLSSSNERLLETGIRLGIRF